MSKIVKVILFEKAREQNYHQWFYIHIAVFVQHLSVQVFYSSAESPMEGRFYYQFDDLIPRDSVIDKQGMHFMKENN